MAKYRISRQEGMGFFNLIIWDSILVVAAAIVLLDPKLSPFELDFELHMVFRVLIGAAAAVLSYLIMKIPVLGAVVQLCFGVIWGAATCYALESLFGIPGRFEDDAVLYWTIIVLIYGIFILLHFLSVKRGLFNSGKIIVETLDEPYRPEYDGAYDDYDVYDEEFEADYAEKQKKVPPLESTDGADCLKEIESEIARYGRLLDGFNEMPEKIRRESGGDSDLECRLDAVSLLWENSTDRMNNYIEIFNEAESDRERKRIIVRMREYVNELADETNGLQSFFTARLSDRLHSIPKTETQTLSFFNGCDTREKLDKRYKNLAKSFHPDLEAGDNESMQLVNEEYERLKRQFS